MTYGDLNYTTEEINADLKKVHDKESVVDEAPSDGKQYGRKDGAWAEIEASTQYLDLSMFPADNGTLSEEDYQKVVKAYEDKVLTGSMGGTVIPLTIMKTGDGSFNIFVTQLSNISDIIVACIAIIISKDKNYTANTESSIQLLTNGSGTKALTDNGQYAEFAKPTKVESGGSGTVTKHIKPNTFYKFGQVAALTITLAEGTSGIVNEYMFEFVSGSAVTTLSVPETVKWSGGEAPTIEANKTYQVSIVNNLAVYAAF